jgi:SNF2 family DNA or RNA helicase
MSLARVTGRVLTVRPDEMGTSFSVTVGPPPDLFWFRCDRKPPKLGQKVRVTAEMGERRNIGTATLPGTITALHRAKHEVVEDVYATRVVPPAWLQRVQQVMARPLYRYQADGAGWMCSRLGAGAGAILGDDPGLGKSAQAVAALVATRSFPAVVCCPSPLKEHWAREFGFSNDPPQIQIIHGKEGQLYQADVYILNYELLRFREGQLEALRPRVYVFDEAQNLKAPQARGKHRAAVATRLVRKTRGALLLTGTPVMNRPAEFWRLLHLSDPKKWPSFANYKARYLEGRKGKEVGRNVRTSAGKVERLDDLHASIAPYMLRRLKHQVLADLPPKSRRSALVRIGDAEMVHYRRAERDVVAWLKGIGQLQRAASAARAQSIVQLTMLRRLAAIGKLRSAVPNYLRAWFNRNASEPLVVFGYHRDVILGLWQICRQLGLRVSGIGGKEAPSKRQQQVDAFMGGMADVFIAPIKTAGVGLNLQRASEALFVERIWTPSGMIQAEDRLWRLGQTRPVVITYLDAAGTVDEHVAEVLAAKQRLINAIVDDRQQGAESMATVTEVADRISKANQGTEPRWRR